MVNHVRGEDVDAKKGPGPVLVGLKSLKGQSEEKCLFGRDKYGLNMNFVYQKDPSPTDISNKDEPHRPMAKKET